MFLHENRFLVGVWSGHPPSLCVFAETCGAALALEHNGDLFSCNHFVVPDHRLGNIYPRSRWPSSRRPKSS